MQPFSKTADLSLPELKKPNSRDARNIRELPQLGVSRTPSQGYPRLGREVNNYMPEDYDRPQSDKNKMSMEVSKGISYLDVVTRVRDIERKYIDLASSLDRRVQAFIEENPQKILRHLRNIEDKEVTLWKESQQKQLALQDGLDIVKGSVRENNDGINSLLNQISRRLDENDFKMESVMKGLDSVNRHRAQENRLAITDKAYDHEHKVGTMEAEIRVLKEALGQERQKREMFFNDIMQQYQDINNQLHLNGNDILGKFRRHKDDMLEENRRNIDQQRKLEEMRIEKILGDSEYVRSLIRQVENKVEDEVNKRLKHEFENKNWMEQKMSLFKQEIKADEKDLLENEKKFLGNIQESMNSLNIIVTNTREQLEANLASTQTLFNDNVKSLSKTIELLKNNVYSKLNAFDTSVKDLDARVSDTQKGFHEHTITINETLEKEFGRIEKVTMKFEEIMNAALKAQDDKLVMFEENNKLWKKNFEDKNLRVLTEISNALKTLKGDLNKEKLSTVERFDLVKEEIASNQVAAEKLFEQLNDRIKGVETQFEYRIEETFVKADEKLRRAVDILDQDIEKMGKATFEKSKKDSQASVNAAEQRSRVYTDQEITKAKEELLKNNRTSIENLRSEVSKDFQSVNLKLADYQNQRSDDMKNLQGEIKYVHDRVTELKDESREGIKRLSDEFDGKIKLTILNAKNFASDRVKELREEVNKQFAAQSEFVKTEVDLAKAHNGKLINELNDKIHGDMEQQKVEISKRYDDLLDEERKIRGTKDTEILNAVEGVKKMLMETINTKIESTQALARALVMEEAAERARSIENLNQTFKRRVEALEKYLKELISTTVEEAKLELKELLKLLEIKFENHKVWTIKELNIIIRDVEEYVLSETVSRYREELYAKVQEKERAEHWRQIEEAFQVVGAKFEDMDLLKRDELEMLDRRLYEMEERNAQDHEAIYQRIDEVNGERKQHTDEVAVIVQENGQMLQQHEQKLEDHEKQIDEHTENLYDLDEKFTNRMEDLSIKLQVQDYVNSLYDKVDIKMKKEEDDEYRAGMKKKFKRVDDQMVLIDERFDENEKTLETFEQKTENNFKIAEKALLAHRDFINQVDARLTVEEMYASILVKNIENKIAAELHTVTSQVDLVNEELEKQFTEKMEKYQKRLEEDFIQHHVLSLEDKINNMKKELQEGDHKTKDEYQQQMSEQSVKMTQHEEALKKCQEEIEKAKVDLNTHFDLRAKEDGENAKVKLDELTQRLDLIQKEGFSEEIKQDIKKMIMEDVQKTLDTDVQTLMEKNMQILIEKDISKLIDRETNKVVKNELATYEQKLKDVEAKIAKGGNGNEAGSGAVDAELKKEVDNVKDLIAKIQKELLDNEKANTELGKKIENMNANITGIEKTVKGEIDKTYNNQNVNHKAVTDQLSKLLDQFQNIQTKLDK